MHALWIVWGVVGVAAAAGLAVLVRTRWLQSHTLSKCVLLSVLLHAVLAAVCALVGGIRPASWGVNDDGRMSLTVALSTDPADDEIRDAPAARDVADATPAPPMEETAAVEPAAVEPLAPTTPLETLPLLEVKSPDPEPPAPRETAIAEPDSAPATAEAGPAEAVADAGPLVPTGAPRAAPAFAPAQPHAVPAAYADRADGRRAAAAAARGGSEETERAVRSALAWLAEAQSGDGRWAAARHGAGVERSVQGQHRQGAGARSDHGVTGLALLAFLGALIRELRRLQEAAGSPVRVEQIAGRVDRRHPAPAAAGAGGQAHARDAEPDHGRLAVCGRRPG